MTTINLVTGEGRTARGRKARPPAATVGSVRPSPAVAVWGLGPQGGVLDVPTPPTDLPARVRGRLQRIAYACAFARAGEAGGARRCPHKGCPLWPHRLGRWAEYQGTNAPEGEMVAYLDGLTGGPPPAARVECVAKGDPRPVQVPLFGALAKAKNDAFGPAGRVVPTAPNFRVSYAHCESCGREFSPRRKSAKYCSRACADRAYRKRVRA